jgi:hypothetical protein
VDELCERVPGTLYLKSALWVGAGVGYCPVSWSWCYGLGLCSDEPCPALLRHLADLKVSAARAARYGHRLSAQMIADEAAAVEAGMRVCAGQNRSELGGGR